jgi:hypothetical protein
MNCRFRHESQLKMTALEVKDLHTGEVQGSIPCAPTSLRSRCELRLGKPPNHLASEGCHAEALGEGGPS